MAYSNNYQQDGDRLVQGINAVIRIADNTAGTNKKEIGFVESYQIRKNITVQKAEVIGELMPVSIDPTSVSVTVSLSGFIPHKDLDMTTLRANIGHSLKEFNPDFISETNVGAKLTKIPYLELYDHIHDSIIGYTTWLVITSYEDGGQGKGYVKANVNLEGIGYFNGTGYDTIV